MGLADRERSLQAVSRSAHETFIPQVSGTKARMGQLMSFLEFCNIQCADELPGVNRCSLFLSSCAKYKPSRIPLTLCVCLLKSRAPDSLCLVRHHNMHDTHYATHAHNIHIHDHNI